MYSRHCSSTCTPVWLDKDVRVRYASATALCAYVRGHETLDDSTTTTTTTTPNDVVVFNELVSERVFHPLPAPLRYALDAAVRQRRAPVDERLCRVLFRLTNDLLRLGDKAQQVGAVGGNDGEQLCYPFMIEMLMNPFRCRWAWSAPFSNYVATFGRPTTPPPTPSSV